MKIRFYLAVTLLAAVCLTAFLVSAVSFSNTSVIPSSQNAYSAIVKASDSGANVGPTVSMFNQALTDEETGNQARANSSFNSAYMKAVALQNQAINSERLATFESYSLAVLFSVLVTLFSVLGYRLYSRIKIERVLDMELTKRYENQKPVED